MGIDLAEQKLFLLDAFAPLDRGLAAMRFKLFEKTASGQVVLVGIDTRSLQTLDVWPWPREYHAALLNILMEAGARDVAFDIDFSSYSNEKSDAAFEQALKDAGGRAVLATFKQPVVTENGETIYIQTVPIPRFARHARLGHVNVQVEPDSLVWRYRPAENMENTHVPGMSAILAGDRVGETAPFIIDYGIAPETVPYISYADILAGNFDPEAIKDKSIIIGAAELELGDRIPVPIHRVLPGPVVQLMAADTMVQGTGLNYVNRYIVAAIALLAGVLFALGFVSRSWQAGAIAVLVSGAVVFLAALLLQGKFNMLVEVSPILFAPAAVYLVNLTRSIDRLTVAYQKEFVDSLYRRAMMDAVIDSGFDGIAIADQAGRIELVNPSGRELIGRDLDEISGKPIRDYLPSTPEIEAYFRALSDEDEGANADSVGPVECILERAEDERELEMVVSTAKLSFRASKRQPAEERVVHIYTFHDITDRKAVERAQKQAAEEASAANRAKTEFLHNMSHELRTPLNAIIGFSEMIKSEILGPLGVPQYQEYINDINNSGEHLLEIVNDILDMSKIEAGKMDVIEGLLEVGNIIEATTRIVNERAWSSDVKLITEINPGAEKLFGDERLIKQMVLNLLSNAVKFTDSGGSVTLRAGKSATGGIDISVQDTGIGIDPSQFDVIVEPFCQADASLTRDYEGTGLGLPLVKSMIELHDGTLGIESVPGEGSTFTLSFPPERCGAQAETTAKAASADSATDEEVKLAEAS